jgi:outer membrane protein TolC
MQNAQRYSVWITILTIARFMSPVLSHAQQITVAPLTIRQAVENAVTNYPSITVSQEQINAASAGIDLARAAYLPRVDSLVQVNRATRNNVFGLLFLQGVIPSISGPVLGSNNFGTAWGSAVGGLITWEPFDFGLRRANVSAATALRSRAEATLKRTEFDVSVATADAYLTTMATEETVRAAQAAVARDEVLLRSVRALTDAQLRPGADASRAEAELAAARTQLAQAQQAVAVAKSVFAQFVGLQPQQVILTAPKLLQLPPDQGVPTFESSQNPIAEEQTAIVEQRKAELDALEKSYAPRFYAQGSAYARGTGAAINGTRLGGLNGLAPDTQNYALGFSVTFPALDFAALHAREAAQSATLRAETARSQQISTELTAQWNAALATLSGSRTVAMNTPVQVAAASTAVQQATARYQSGLGAIVEVADAQRLLTQAQIDDALARLNVWRALLRVAISAGDIQPFLSASQ